MEFLLIILLLVGCLYFLPSLIAAYRNTHHLSALFFLNLFLGWTFFGWVMTLFIALLIDKREDYEARRIFFNSQVGAQAPLNARGSRIILFIIVVILTIVLVASLSENAPHLMSILHNYTSEEPSNVEF